MHENCVLLSSLLCNILIIKSNLLNKNKQYKEGIIRSGLGGCEKAHCKLGCICDDYDDDDDDLLLLHDDNNDYAAAAASTSENNNSRFEREHCGRVECMFVCNCIRKLRSSDRKSVGGKGNKNINSKKANADDSI